MDDHLGILVSTEYPRLVGAIGLYCGDAHVAEDIAQEAFIRLCRDWEHVSKMDEPVAWLRRVAINLAHSHYRRAARRRVVESLAGRDRNAPDVPAHDIETLQLLTGLPARQRAALILHYYLDMRVREVADVMDLPEGTIKTLIHRATRALRAEQLAKGETGCSLI